MVTLCRKLETTHLSAPSPPLPHPLVLATLLSQKFRLTEGNLNRSAIAHSRDWPLTLPFLPMSIYDIPLDTIYQRLELLWNADYYSRHNTLDCPDRILLYKCFVMIPWRSSLDTWSSDQRPLVMFQIHSVLERG